MNASFRSALATGCAFGAMALAVPAHAQDPETVTPVEDAIVQEDAGTILVPGSRIKQELIVVYAPDNRDGLMAKLFREGIG